MLEEGQSDQREKEDMEKNLENGRVINVVYGKDTTFTIILSRRGYILKTSGRINCTRLIRRYFWQRAAMRARARFTQRWRWLQFYHVFEMIKEGDFTVIEGQQEYSFHRSEDEWIIKKGGINKRVKKEGVGLVVSGSLSAEDLFESGEGMEPIKREIAQILERLSNMLNSGFDEEVYQEAKKIAEQTGEEHVKDMLRIVEKRLRRTKGTEKEIKIRIIK